MAQGMVLSDGGLVRLHTPCWRTRRICLNIVLPAEAGTHDKPPQMRWYRLALLRRTTC